MGTPRALPAASLIVLVALSGVAGAHAGSSIEVIARDGTDCTGSEVCLELFSLPPDLKPGRTVQFELRNHPDASRAYAASLTTIEQADPDRRDTPASAAIASTGPVEPGNRSHVDVTVPQASQAYAWLTGDGHEASGGFEVIPLAPASEATTGEGPRPAPGPGLVVPLAVGLAALGARRARL